jgi:hypothetical protein
MNILNTPTKFRKSRSKFAHLPPEDQKRVIELCDQHTYNEALEILAKPRPEGLQLESSYGALVRFYTSHNQHARAAHLLGQSARTIQLTRQAHPGALRGAILTLVESRIYDALRRSVPIAELSNEFATLKDFHRGFLSEEKWRTAKDSPANNEASLLTSHRLSEMEDFVPLDEHGHPASEFPPTGSEKPDKSTFIQLQPPANPHLST